METKARANAVVGFALGTGPGGETLMTFSVKGAGETTLDLGKVSEEVKARAAIHGLKQRVSDAAAQSRVIVDGRETNATPANKLAAMQAIVEHYNSGSVDWRLKGGERIGTDEGLLARALAEVYPDRDSGKLRAYVGGLTKVERTKLLMTGAIKVAADKLREAETTGVDTDELLAKLEGATDK